MAYWYSGLSALFCWVISSSRQVPQQSWKLDITLFCHLWKCYLLIKKNELQSAFGPCVLILADIQIYSMWEQSTHRRFSQPVLYSPTHTTKLTKHWNAQHFFILQSATWLHCLYTVKVLATGSSFKMDHFKANLNIFMQWTIYFERYKFPLKTSTGNFHFVTCKCEIHAIRSCEPC